MKSSKPPLVLSLKNKTLSQASLNKNVLLQTDLPEKNSKQTNFSLNIWGPYVSFQNFLGKICITYFLILNVHIDGWKGNWKYALFSGWSDSLMKYVSRDIWKIY